MSCGDRTRPVNPERLGEPGRWVLPRTRPIGASGCRHASEYRNAHGIAGGPVVKVCIRCGDIQGPTWVPDVAARPALPAAAPAAGRAWPYLVGESEWADLLRERGAA